MSVLTPLIHNLYASASSSRLPIAITTSLRHARVHNVSTSTSTSSPRAAAGPRTPEALERQKTRRDDAIASGHDLLASALGSLARARTGGQGEGKDGIKKLASLEDELFGSDFDLKTGSRPINTTSLSAAFSPSSSSAVSSTSSAVDDSLRVGYSPSALPPREDPVLGLLTNLLMKHGKKEAARKIVREVLNEIQRTTHRPPLPLLHSATFLTSPSIRLTSLRRSSKIVQIPSALTARQRTRQGLQWILKAAEKGRAGATRGRRIAREVVAVLEGTSAALARKEEVHKLGAANRSNLNTR